MVGEVVRRRLYISARFDHDLEEYLTHLREIERRFEDCEVSQVTVIRPASAAEPVESWRARSATARSNVPLPSWGSVASSLPAR